MNNVDNLDDIGNKNRYILLDPFEHVIPNEDFVRVINYQNGENPSNQKNDGQNIKRHKNYKKGSQENWDKQFRSEIQNYNKQIEHLLYHEKKEFEKTLKRNENALSSKMNQNQI